jgi:hypothetical protein
MIRNNPYLLLLVFAYLPALGASAHAQGVPPPAPGQEKLDSIRTAIDALQKQVEQLQATNWIRDIGPTAVGLLGLVVTIIISVVSLNRNATLTRRSIEEKAREEERKAIREKLDQFYGPFTQLRGVSKHLYTIFTARLSDEVKRQFPDKDGKFRTLIALTRGHKFQGVEKNLLDEIVKVGSESEKLILEKVGLVDDRELQAQLWLAGAHYRIIRLANEDKLTGGGIEFESFTFPYDLDMRLSEMMAALNQRLAQLTTT